MTTDILVLQQLGAVKLEQAMEEARTVVLMRCKLVLDQGGRREPQPGFVQTWWRSRVSAEVSVMLVVDDALPCAWVEVTDSDDAQRVCMVAALKDHLAVVPPRQLAVNASAWPPKKGALAALAISRDSSERETLVEAVRRALRDGSPEVKVEAAFATATAALGQLRDELRHAKTSEPPGAARDAIARALDLLSRA